MKNCTHCGVPIKGNAAVFCPKCKKPLKPTLKKRRPAPTKPNQPVQSNKKPTTRRSNPPPVKTIPQVKKEPSQNIIYRFRMWLSDILNPEKEQKTDVENTPVTNPMDENYDGYYDDKPTEDNAQDKEILDPELIKRIVFISGGALAFVILIIILMQAL